MNALASNIDEDLALELGGKLVRNDGSVFNAGGRAGVRRLPTPQPLDTAPVSPPAPTMQDNSGLVKALEQMVQKLQPQPMLAPEVHVAAPQVTVQPQQRVLEWEFTFVRNPDGSIKSIKAKANG